MYLRCLCSWRFITCALRWDRVYRLSICVEISRSTRVPVRRNETGRLVKFVDLCRKWIIKSETWHILRRDIAAASMIIWCEKFNPIKREGSVLILWENTGGPELLLAILLAEVRHRPYSLFSLAVRILFGLRKSCPLGFSLFLFWCRLDCGCPFPVWCLGQDVEFDCIGSWSLPFYLLRVPHITFVLKTLYNRQRVLIVFLIFAKCQQINKKGCHILHADNQWVCQSTLSKFSIYTSTFYFAHSTLPYIYLSMKLYHIF